jgi:hypothetical protein
MSTKMELETTTMPMKRYMGVEELDRKLLIKLIDKIIVGQKVIENGEEKQNVTIIYNLVGQVD